MRLDLVVSKASGIFVPGHEAWRHVPYFHWHRDNRKVKLNANWDDNSNRNYAAPVVWDCSFRERVLRYPLCI